MSVEPLQHLVIERHKCSGFELASRLAKGGLCNALDDRLAADHFEETIQLVLTGNLMPLVNYLLLKNLQFRSILFPDFKRILFPKCRNRHGNRK